jgi:Cys-rich protein (TIGR01571 family)
MFIWPWLVPFGFQCMQTLDAKWTSSEKHSALVACMCSCYLGCVGAGYNRHVLRKQLGIHGNLLVDILLELFLPCCAVSQEWREVMKHKGHSLNTPIWDAAKNIKLKDLAPSL